MAIPPFQHCIAGVFFQMTFHKTSENNVKANRDMTYVQSFHNNHKPHIEYQTSPSHYLWTIRISCRHTFAKMKNWLEQKYNVSVTKSNFNDKMERDVYGDYFINLESLQFS